VRAPTQTTLEVEGEKTIDMRDFNLTPPRFLISRSSHRADPGKAGGEAGLRATAIGQQMRGRDSRRASRDALPPMGVAA